MADQPYWGRRVYELGVGAPFIRRHELNRDKLADAIQLMLNNPQIAEKAAQLGAVIRAEDGVQNAVKAFDMLLKH